MLQGSFMIYLVYYYSNKVTYVKLYKAYDKTLLSFSFSFKNIIVNLTLEYFVIKLLVF
jgi:hypothetical protein